MTPLRAFANRYDTIVKTYPLSSKCLTASSLFLLGDVIYQVVEKKPEWDYKRMCRMAIFGGAVFGPAGHYWYHLLETKLPGTTKREVFLKVLADQAVFAPPFYASFFYIMPLLEGKSHQQRVENVKQNFVTTILVDLSVWPTIQAVNFRYVPGDHRVLFVSAVSIGWNAFLSKMQHGHGHHEPALPAPATVSTPHKVSSKVEKTEKTEKSELVAIGASPIKPSELVAIGAPSTKPVIPKKLENNAIALK